MSNQVHKEKIVSLLMKVMSEGSADARQDQLVFGEDLDLLLYETSAEAVRARRYLDLFVSALSQDKPRLDISVKALRSAAKALVGVAESLGKFSGNPNRHFRGASAERVTRRYFELKDE